MSEKSLDQLIASLKSEAIEAAEKESNEILEEARSQAQKILKEAEKTRKQILMEAENEAQATIQKGESALQQAARDLYIALRNDLLQLFNAVLEKEIHTAFTPDLLKSAVAKVIENIGSEVELKLPADFEKELADYIHKRLQSSDPVSIIKEDSLLKELTITKTDQGWSYEISPEEIAGLLQSRLIGKWAEVLKNDA
jgi:cell division septum initiation protein DivIVA